MIGLAEPPTWWDADTAKPGAVNTGLAGCPGGRLENTADVTRHGTLSSSQDDCCTPVRQEGSWWGASALRWESEMDAVFYSDQYNSDMRRRADLAVWAKSGGRCWYCGKQCRLPPAELMERMTIDHMTPWKRGGSHGIENLVPACFSCNSVKRNRDIDEYRWALLRMASVVPTFSEKQQIYLASVGFVYERCVGPCLSFWFEREGLQA